MKRKSNKQPEEYDKKEYAAKFLLTYLQSCFPYCCDWTSYYQEYEPGKYLDDTHFSEHSEKTKNKE